MTTLRLEPRDEQIPFPSLAIRGSYPRDAANGYDVAAKGAQRPREPVSPPLTRRLHSLRQTVEELTPTQEQVGADDRS